MGWIRVESWKIRGDGMRWRRGREVKNKAERLKKAYQKGHFALKNMCRC